MASIRCGNCKATHTTVEAVKACYSGTAGATITIEQGEEELLPCEVAAIASGKAQPVPTARLASVKQVEFILSLQMERNCLQDRVEVERMTKAEASDTITTLLAMPKERLQAGTAQVQQASTGNALVVPEGLVSSRYAVEMDGTLKFYKVNCPTEGKWAGRIFIDVQASDDTYPVRNPASRQAILSAIGAAGVMESIARYGLELGHCGICGRTLTDEQSRARGIGPVCWDKF